MIRINLIKKQKQVKTVHSHNIVPMLNKNLRIIAVFTLVIMGLLACTKKRPDTFPDGVGDTMYEKSAILATKMEVTTAQAPIPIKDEEQLLAKNEVPKYALADVEGPDAFKPMFQDLTVEGEANKKYIIGFAVDDSYVTALKIIPSQENSTLSQEEQAIAYQNPQNKAEKLVPIFKYAIQMQGIAVHEKNSLGEDTSTLRLQPTEPARATHLQFIAAATYRLAVAAPRAIAETVFLKQKLEENLFTKAELAKKLNLEVAADDDNTKFALQVVGDNLAVFEISQKSRITANQQEFLSKLSDQQKNARSLLQACQDSGMSALKGNQDKDCVSILRYTVPIQHQVAKLSDARPDNSATKSNIIEFEQVGPSTNSQLIQIAKRSEPQEAVDGVDKILGYIDPRRIINIEQTKGQDYYLRSTLMDAGNISGLVSSSSIPEVVHFEFKESQVNIVRSYPLYKDRGANKTDLETIISIPAEYYVLQTTDERGNVLPKPLKKAATYKTKNAIAYVDWTQVNRNNVNSVLSGTNCFQFVNTDNISQVDIQYKNNTLEKLGITLDSIYQMTAAQCESWSEAGHAQLNYNFKERLSLLKYEKPGNNFVTYNIPNTINKKLGYGIIQINKKTANQIGSFNQHDSVTFMPVIHDISDGKKITYILRGLPEAGEERERVIQASREAIADLNAGFHKALANTALDRKDDIVELKIETVDVPETTVMGDLDTNHINYVNKATSNPYLGVYYVSPDPLTGQTVNASVYIFAGNIQNNILQYQYAAKFVSQNASSGNSTQNQIAPTAIANSNLFMAKPNTNAFMMTTNSKKQNAIFSNADALLKSNFDLSSLSEVDKIGYGALKNFQLRKNNLQALKYSNPTQCAFTVPTFGYAITDDIQDTGTGKESGMIDVKTISYMDLYINEYKTALLHELLHAMGLQHNFLGSYDKENWIFGADDNSDRRYSSVMDYNPPEIRYEGMGPYDVAALRYAYTGGLMELNADQLDKIQKVIGADKFNQQQVDIANINQGTGQRNKITIHNQRFVKAEDFAKSLGAQNVVQLNDFQLGSSGLKPKSYQYCDDYDTNFISICNRHDIGTTPAEIVKHYIDEYNMYYDLAHLPQDRVNFGLQRYSDYTQGVADSFLKIRQFLDDYFYYKMTGQQEQAKSYQAAALQGDLFFQNIIMAPDAPAELLATGDYNDRVVQIEDEQGKQVTIGRKWLHTMYDQRNDQLNVIGVEFDKAFAMLMLASNGIGSSNYALQSKFSGQVLDYSYIDFEKEIFGNKIKSSAQLPTVSLINNILANKITAATISADGSLLALDGLASDATDMMKYFTLQAVVSNFNNAQPDIQQNDFSKVLGILKGKNRPKDRPSAQASVAGVYFWAQDKDSIANSLIQQLASMQVVRSQMQDLLTAYYGDFSPLYVKIIEWAGTQGIKNDELAKDAKDGFFSGKLLDAINAEKAKMPVIPAAVSQTEQPAAQQGEEDEEKQIPIPDAYSQMITASQKIDKIIQAMALPNSSIKNTVDLNKAVTALTSPAISILEEISAKGGEQAVQAAFTNHNFIETLEVMKNQLALVAKQDPLLAVVLGASPDIPIWSQVAPRDTYFDQYVKLEETVTALGTIYRNTSGSDYYDNDPQAVDSTN